MPDAALLHREWWTDADAAVDAAGGSNYADAWILAKRTAVPNLPARIVVFARACWAAQGLFNCAHPRR